MSDTFDELRIIVSDARGMSASDRDVLRRAADEGEHLARLLIQTQEQLIVSQQQRIALNDAMLAMRTKQVAPKVVFPTISSGWMTGVPNQKRGQ